MADPYAPVRVLTFIPGAPVYRPATEADFLRYTVSTWDENGPRVVVDYDSMRADGWRVFDDGGGVSGGGGVTAEKQTGALEWSVDFYSDAALVPFASKYGGVKENPDGSLTVKLQQPGAHKYDTAVARYVRVSGNTFRMVGDPTPTREVSTAEQVRDTVEVAAAFVATSAALYGVGVAVSGLTSAGAATAGATSGASTGAAVGASTTAGAGAAAGASAGAAAGSTISLQTIAQGAGLVSTAQEYADFFEPHGFADANPPAVASDAATSGYGFQPANPDAGANNFGDTFASVPADGSFEGYGSPSPSVEPVGDFGVQDYPFGPSPADAAELRGSIPNNPIAQPSGLADTIARGGRVVRDTATAARDVVSGLGILYQGVRGNVPGSTQNQRVPVTSIEARQGQYGPIANSTPGLSGDSFIPGISWGMLALGAAGIVGVIYLARKG